jgi:acyl transferase domain-containing protein
MPDDTPIAVIGLSYRAPGIGRTGIWDYLSQARSAWSNIPADRFEKSAYYKLGADKSGVFRAQGAHFVPDDIYAFDAGFFNMRAEEAQNSDPQHRMMLECVLEAAEDAGKTLLDLAGQKIGVYIGSGQHEYSQRLGDDQFSAKTFSATGVAPCMAANRVSYFLDIDGPSITLDAACASSVYAAHQAVSALRNGECTSAFVGSSALSLGPGGWLALEKTGYVHPAWIYAFANC